MITWLRRPVSGVYVTLAAWAVMAQLPRDR
jgi:hypothetical protein